MEKDTAHKGLIMLNQILEESKESGAEAIKRWRRILKKSQMKINELHVNSTKPK